MKLLKCGFCVLHVQTNISTYVITCQMNFSFQFTFNLNFLLHFTLLICLLGDLTEARRSRFDTNQYIEEWQSYHNIVKETGVANNRPWLDLPGNHGNL